MGRAPGLLFLCNSFTPEKRGAGGWGRLRGQWFSSCGLQTLRPLRLFQRVCENKNCSQNTSMMLFAFFSCVHLQKQRWVNLCLSLNWSAGTVLVVTSPPTKNATFTEERPWWSSETNNFNISYNIAWLSTIHICNVLSDKIGSIIQHVCRKPKIFTLWPLTRKRPAEKSNRGVAWIVSWTGCFFKTHYFPLNELQTNYGYSELVSQTFSQRGMKCHFKENNR